MQVHQRLTDPSLVDASPSLIRTLVQGRFVRYGRRLPIRSVQQPPRVREEVRGRVRGRGCTWPSTAPRADRKRRPDPGTLGRIAEQMGSPRSAARRANRPSHSRETSWQPTTLVMPAKLTPMTLAVARRATTATMFATAGAPSVAAGVPLGSIGPVVDSRCGRFSAECLWRSGRSLSSPRS